MDNTAPTDRPTDPADRPSDRAPAPPAGRPPVRLGPAPSRRPRDMVISLLVLLVPVVLFVGVYQVLSGRNQPVEVDPQPALSSAAAAGIEVASPHGLAAGWVPVSAVFQPGADGDTVRVGYVTPDGGSMQLVQSTVPAERLLPEVLPEPATPAGTVDLAGRSWQVYPPRTGQRALVLLEREQTTIVLGTSSGPELRELAAALRLP